MKKKVLVFFLVLLLGLTLPLPASANAAEPPRLSVVVLNPPKDLELSLVFTRNGEEEPVQAEASRLAWEGYYLFRPASFPSFWDWDDSPEDMTITLVAKIGGESVSIPLDNETLSQNTGSYYNNLCVLDLSAGTLTPGAPWWRQPVLILLRLGLTLVLEGLVFLLFGYRTKRSWVVFLVVNLITQGAVNALLLWGIGPFGNLYSVGIASLLLYVPMELVVIGVEIAAFRKLLREKKKLDATVYAIVANLVSWALGGAMLTYLPL
ncbi:MAG: hypothetical protein ACOYJZ_01570 [Acutalibacter sp.]|jgi:hypothetical protein